MILSYLLPKECLTATLKYEEQEQRACSVPSWHVACSDVLYILINQAQTHRAHVHMYACIQKCFAICVYLQATAQHSHLTCTHKRSLDESVLLDVNQMYFQLFVIISTKFHFMFTFGNHKFNSNDFTVT